MPLATRPVKLDGTSLRVATLPVGSRTPTTITVTVATGGAAIGATTIPVTALAAALQESQQITWSTNETVVLAADAASGATSVTIRSPLVTALAAGATASVIPTFLIEGGRSQNFQMNDNTVSLRDYQSDIWEDSGIVSKSGTVQFSGLLHDKSPALTSVVIPAAIPTTNVIPEVWAEVFYPNGIIRRGAAQLRNYQEQAPLDDYLQIQMDVVFLGRITSVMPPLT